MNSIKPQFQPSNKKPNIIHRSPSQVTCCTQCRKCRKQGDEDTAIVPCRCLGYIHQECLMRQISQAEVTQSDEYPEYKQYICPKCSGSILFLPNFREYLLTFAERNGEEMFQFIKNIVYIFLSLGALVFDILLLVEEEIEIEIEIWILVFTIIIAILRIIMSIYVLIQGKYCTFYYGPVRRRQRQETERNFIPT